jgi:uncharacterized protein YjiS (DUF1127 family)
MEPILRTSIQDAVDRQVGHSPLSRSTATLKRLWVAFGNWRTERRAIAELSSMSERELKDIGLHRSGIVGAMRESALDHAFCDHDRHD